MANISRKEWLRIRDSRGLPGPEKEAAMEQIAKQYEKLVYKAARDVMFHCGTDEFEDLVQRGIMGLKDAANSFERGKAKFATFAYPRVLAFMVRGEDGDINGDLVRRRNIKHNDDAIDVLEDDKQKCKKHKGTAAERKKRNAEEEDDKWCEEQRGKLKSKSSRVFVSLQDENEEGESLLDCIPSNDDPFREALIGEIWQIASALPERTREVLEMRYKEGLTLEEAGAELGLTRERIRQIEGEALASLKKKINGKNGGVL